LPVVVLRVCLAEKGLLWEDRHIVLRDGEHQQRGGDILSFSARSRGDPLGGRHALSSLQNIRLSSDAVNSLTRSQN
jgi:hypothetical protein